MEYVGMPPFENFVQTHDFLIAQDTEYAGHWNSLSADHKKALQLRWKEIEEFALNTKITEEIDDEAAFKVAQRFFVRVQEREFEYGRVARNWYFFVQDQENLEQLYRDSRRRLDIFLNRYSTFTYLFFYGGIKPSTSIRRKLAVDGESSKDIKIRPEMPDLWDAVRFRIVLSDFNNLRECAMLFWEVFIDDIIRCRNYYYRPRGVAPYYYRAIHFEIADRLGRIVEVQMLTINREAVSTIDHPLLFKKRMKLQGGQQKSWLLDRSSAANKLDTLQLMQG